MQVYNQTRFVHEKTMGLDKAGREYLSFVFKGTWDFPEKAGEPAQLAEIQTPLIMADEYSGEPAYSAPVRETDFAFRKPHPEVIVHGAAYAPQGKQADRVRVGVRVDDWSKQFDVVGYREWQVIGPVVRATKALPFRRVPIGYDHAFGGQDRFDPEDETPKAYRDNPVGCGFASPTYQDQLTGVALPLTEAIGEEVTSPYGSYKPMALGPIGRNWPDRAKYAGTYDQNYVDNIFPFLPPDFDDRYFQSAPLDQWLRGLREGAPVLLVGLTPAGREQFALPKTKTPVTLFRNGKICLEQDITADTLLIDTEARQFSLVWRLEARIQKAFIEFNELWLGPPTEPMVRAREEGRRYIRAVAEIGNESEDA
ncbi:DUF2169 domain-containing protein [uncultured Tateyamaria sp.]|uniref:DUF2169 family type VI secretion system accessory protein n=1 Tax=uncultured Tateyamaria sp. TaxID=455651 RepID=UPI0026281950|nr:DUF2169 domain-containing protein [uncultured Tateyamaria sp.]